MDEVERSCKASGVRATFVGFTPEKFYEALSVPQKANVDFMLLGYMAGEKFPMTQLKLLLADIPLPFEIERSETVQRGVTRSPAFRAKICHRKPVDCAALLFTGTQNIKIRC